MSASEDRGLAGHPRGLAVLFAAEMWERFSFYGMRALLTLYMVQVLAYSDTRAAHVYGMYTGLVWLTPLVGGYLADRYLGTRRSLIIGGLIIAAGHFVLAIPGTAWFYPGLALVVIGTGFFKPNASTMVGQLYAPGDRRRDAGYTIFYMGINIGGFIAPLICGWLGQRVGWHYGFGAAGVGMVIGLVIYIWLRDRYLPGIGVTPAGRAVTAVPQGPLSADEWRRILALGIVFLFVSSFWISYEQAGSSLTLFTDRFVNLHLGGRTIPSSWFQSAQPFFVLVFAPLFASLWSWLGNRGREPSTALKMVFGLAILGVGFVFMVIAGQQADACRAAGSAASCAVVSPVWLVFTYMFSVFGELCLSPVGLSYVSKVAPPRVVARCMGAWFLTNAIGNYLAGTMAGLMPRFPLTLGTFFGLFCIISLVAAGLLLLFVPLLKRLTASVTDS